jgi:hypothetical protein
MKALTSLRIHSLMDYGEVIKSLGGGALLEEVGHWRLQH